eukprot:scaffold388968_cov55-Prasinocladus_malaysianus.AAC.2
MSGDIRETLMRFFLVVAIIQIPNVIELGETLQHGHGNVCLERPIPGTPLKTHCWPWHFKGAMNAVIAGLNLWKIHEAGLPFFSQVNGQRLSTFASFSSVHARLLWGVLCALETILTTY